MKKLSLGFMAFALATVSLFTSCGDDDDDDSASNNSISNLSATVKDGSFSTSMAGFYSSQKSDSTGTKVLNKFFTDENSTSTCIAGISNGKHLAINIKGTTSGTYVTQIGSSSTVNNLLIDLLSGKTIKDVIQEEVKTEALIIYRTSTSEDENSTNYWFSTEATVNFNLLAIYATGTFTATMMNKSGDKFTISDGSFKVFGKPITTAK